MAATITLTCLFFLSVTMKELPKICFITEFGILLMGDGSDGI